MLGIGDNFECAALFSRPYISRRSYRADVFPGAVRKSEYTGVDA